VDALRRTIAELGFPAVDAWFCAEYLQPENVMNAIQA
jgi:hypothetical protein